MVRSIVNLHDLNADEIRMITFVDRHSIKVLMMRERNEFVFNYSSPEELGQALETWAKAKHAKARSQTPTEAGPTGK